MLKIERFLETAKVPTTGDGINPGALVLPNKTRILAVPGEEANIRGISAVDILIIDEAARVKESLYAGARPMLATRDGKIMLMSTPYSRSGFFFDEWRDGDPEAQRPLRRGPKREGTRGLHGAGASPSCACC